MLALSTLYNLSSELSIANDRLSEDANCPLLIGELVNLFDKHFLPDISLYSLQCINYILDINPAYTSTVKKYGGISKIVLMTQNIEFIDLAENAIKAIEKMSIENAFALLECDAFSSVLNLIDFFDLGLKKAAMRACVNMALSCTTCDLYTKFIAPALPALTSLTKFSVGFTDPQIISNVVLSFVYILTNIKNYYANVSFTFLQFGMLENFFDVVTLYLQDESVTISGDLVKNILKIFTLLSTVSAEAADSILNMNILEIVNAILKKELGISNNWEINRDKSSDNNNSINRNRTFSEDGSKNKIVNNETSFLNEIFNLVLAFFPNSENKTEKKLNGNSNLNSTSEVEKNQKILAGYNKHFYEYLSEKIITLLIGNIITISSCSTLIQVVKLVNVYAKFSSESQVVAFLKPDKIAHIIGKLLDTKETVYLQEVLVLLEILMEKAGTSFIVPFLREGIVDNLNNFDLKIGKIVENLAIQKQKLKDKLKDKLIEKENVYNINRENNNPESEPKLEKGEKVENKIHEINQINQIIHPIKKEENNTSNEITSNAQLENDKIKLDKEDKEIKIESESLLNNKLPNEQDEQFYDDEIYDEQEQYYEDEYMSEDEYLKYGEGYTEEAANDLDYMHQFAKDQEKFYTNYENNLKVEKIQSELEKSDINKNQENNQISTNSLNEIQNPISENANNNENKKRIEDFESLLASSSNLGNNFSLISNAQVQAEKSKLFQTQAQTIPTNQNLISGNKDINPNLYKYDQYERYDRYTQPELKNLTNLEEKLNKLKSLYFTEDKIKLFLNSLKTNENNSDDTNPVLILEKLEELKKQISEFSKSKNENKKLDANEENKIYNLIKSAVDILTDKNKQLTLWELEKSEIFLHLAEFLDLNFSQLYKTQEDTSHREEFTNKKKPKKKENLKIQKELITSEFGIYKKLKMFLKCFDNDKNKIINLIKLIQYSITSMNCFVVYYADTTSSASQNLYRQPYLYKDPYYSKQTQVYAAKFIYREENLQNLIKKLESQQIERINNLNNLLLKKKEKKLNILNTDNFEIIEKMLLKEEKMYEDRQGLFNMLLDPKQDNSSFSNFNKFLMTGNLNTNQNNQENKNNSSDLVGKKSEIKISLNFFLEFEVKGEKVKFKIDKYSTISNLKKELIRNYSPEDLKGMEKDMPIYFEMEIQNCKKVELSKLNELLNQEAKNGSSNTTNSLNKFEFSTTQIQENFNNLEFKINTLPVTNNTNSLFTNLTTENEKSHLEINPSSSEEEKESNLKLFSKLNYSTSEEDNFQNIYERHLFEKFYIDSIVSNPHLYEIKRLSPSLYLLAVLHSSVINFPKLFNIDNLQESLEEINSENKANLLSNNLNNSNNYNMSLLSHFENLKVTNLLHKSARDVSSVSYGSIPSWCLNLSQSFPFLANFNSRFLLFKSTSFDTTRGLINLHNYLRNFSGEQSGLHMKTASITKSKRIKQVIDREDILACTFKLMKENADFKGFIEFEYLNETGTGLGPTLEFYSLIVNKVRENKRLWYNTTDGSLYPAPINETTNYNENKLMFNLLGFVVARALYDDRLIDIPLSSLFWDLVLNKQISFAALERIDKDLGRTIIKDFIKIIKEKHTFLKSNPEFKNEEDYDLGEEVKYNKMRIDEIGLLFNLPGYPEVELKEDGLECLLTIHNIEEYVEGVYDKLFGSGVVSLVNEFRNGFNLVFDVDCLKVFDSKEIEETLCGSLDDKWDYESLYQFVKPDHGYDRKSNGYQFLLQFMLSLQKEEKKKFLMFVTGSPRLPVGGFKNLSPNLTVVKKTTTSNLESPDDYLPTVMTCQNYLKIPDYSSYEIFTERFFTAFNEGANAFLLS